MKLLDANPREFCTDISARKPRNQVAGFTLVELLVVIAVIVVMMMIAVPAFNAIRGSSDFGTEVFDVAGTLDQARAYAMANNTYVLVGVTEETATQSSSATPQTPGTGRVAMVVIASKDGMRPYQDLLNSNSLTAANWQATYANGTADFTAVTKLVSLPNLHLVDLQLGGTQLPTTGNMLRPAVTNYYDVPNTACVSATPIAWPLGASLSGSPVPQYQFTKVIEFSPQGAARIIINSSSNNAPEDAIPYCIEIGLQPTNGTSAPALSSGSSGQIAAIQIDGMSGATRIYQP